MRRSAATFILTPDEVGCGMPPCKEIRAVAAIRPPLATKKMGRRLAQSSVGCFKAHRQRGPASTYCGGFVMLFERMVQSANQIGLDRLKAESHVPAQYGTSAEGR
jgi:hypothetical protein